MGGGHPTLRGIIRKLAAIAALLALIVPGVASLAETLSAANLPACCNSNFCPLRHSQGRNLEKSRSDCSGMDASGQNDCSMRSCDASPNQIVGTAAFLLVAPYAIHGLTFAEAAPAAPSQFLPYVVLVPSPPPPRTFLS